MKENVSIRYGIFFTIFGVLSIFLSACTMGPDYVKPEVETPAQFKFAGGQQGPDEKMKEKWWLLFEDVLLTQLIEESMTNNYDLKAAFHKLEQARSSARIARSGLFPFFNAEPAFQRRGQSENITGVPGGTSDTWLLPFNMGYEIDLFGRIRRGYEASQAETEAVEEDLNSIRLILQTDIALNYFAMRSFDEDIRIVNRAIEVRQEQLKILKNRHKYGAISRLPLARASAELSATEALLYDLMRKRTRIENAIAVLLGKTPSEISLRPDPLNTPPPEIPVVVPSRLLTARPDIRRAERIMAAENARIGVAEASLYPQIRIMGDAGFASSSSGNLFDSTSFTWGIIPSISIPIFEGGRRIADLERAGARYAEVYARYRQTIIRAFGDTENALVSADFLKKQAAANRRAVKSSEQAYQLSKKQYEGGMVNYLSALDSERTFLDNLRLESQLRGQRYISAVNLIKSIGGSW